MIRQIPQLPDIASAKDLPALGRVLMTYFRALRDWLTSQPRWSTYSIEFRGGTIPSKAISSTVIPAGVIPLQLWNTTTNSYQVPSTYFTWYYRDGSVTFPSHGSLSATYNYRFDFLVLEA